MNDRGIMQHVALTTNRCMDAVHAFFFRTAPPHPIAIVRILFGAWMLLYFGIRAPHVDMLFSDAGLVIPYDIGLPEQIALLLQPQSVMTAYAIYTFMLLAILSFTLGFHTRISALICWMMFAYYNTLAFHAYSTSYNRLFLFLFFLFIFSDAGNAFSIDMKRRYGSWLSWESGSVLVQRMIALQVTATYVGVSWQKLWLPMWQGGEILYYSYMGMWATPLARWVAALPLPMLFHDWNVVVVKYLQIAFAPCFWIKKLRLYAIIGGLLFHGAITLFLSAIWWFWAMPAAYILYFEGEEVLMWLRKYHPAIPAHPCERKHTQ